MTARRWGRSCLVLLVAGAWLIGAPPDDDAAALDLIAQAKNVFRLENDSRRALDLLARAETLAQADAVKGRALLESAYIRWMRLESPLVIQSLLSRVVALIGLPGREHDEYPESFRALWKRAARKKAGVRRQRIELELLLNALSCADSRFAGAYGRWHLTPEIRLAGTVFRNWNVWASFSSFGFSGTLPVIQVDLWGYQRFAALGIGWQYALRERLQLSLSLGVEQVWFEERANMEEVNGSCLGWRARVDLKRRIFRAIHLVAGIGYRSAHAVLERRRVQPGGWSLGAGLGWRF